MIARRQFISLLGGAAASWPVAARGQQPVMPVIGFLRSTPSAPVHASLTSSSRGPDRGRVRREPERGDQYRYADNQPDRLSVLVGDLIHRHVAVIIANHPAAEVAKAATTIIPIVFVTGDDPVKGGSFRASTGRVVILRA